MGLKFIYGRSGSGKSYYCLEDIKRSIEKGNNSSKILLVPEQFSFQSEKNLLKFLGEENINKAQVLSFKRLAFKVFNEVGGVTHRHINESGKAMLIYKIMKDINNELKVFKSSAKREGFIKTISEIITEFKRYSITPDALLKSSESIDENTLKSKIEDLGRIYSKFEEALKDKYIDSDDDLTLLLEKLDKSKLFNGAEVWIDEFFDFTPQEYKILEKILIKSKKTNVTLSTDVLEGNASIDNLDLFYPSKNTEEKFLRIIEENNIKFEKPVALSCAPCYRFREKEELIHLEKNLYAFPYREYKKPTEDITLFKALNRYGEIENTARDILKLVRERGYRFKDIAVITGDLEGYENLVRAIFSEYDIPYFIDKKLQISNNPIVVFILSAIEIFTKGWSYEAVFRYLKTGLTDLDEEEIDILENYVLANGIRGKKWTDKGEWSYRIKYGYYKDEEMSEEEKEDIKLINLLKEKISTPLINFHDNLKGSKSSKEMTLALYGFLEEMSITKRIEEWINKFKKIDELDRVNEYNQIWNIVIDLLDQIVEVLKEEEVSIDVFGKLLKSGFEQYELGLIPPSLDQLLVSSIERLRSHQIKALYIIGVNDGVFPKVLASEGLLTDIDRENLKSSGVEVAKDTKSKAFEDQFLTYITMTTMSHYLRVSYPISDYEGKSLRPSIVISKLKRIFPNIKEVSDVISSESIDEEFDKIGTPRSTFNELILNLRNINDSLEIHPLWLSAYDWYINNEEWKDKLINILEGFSHNNVAEILDTQKVRKLYGSKLNISVSRLEKYAECPFSYFVKYGLRAKERKIYKLSTPDIGTLMHEVLEDFSKYIEEKKMHWEDIDKKLCEGIVSNILDEKISNMPGSIFKSSPRYEYMGNSLKRIVSRAVSVIGEQISRGEFKPKDYELSFGFNGDFPPISIELSSGETVNLIGRIDRVDDLKDEKGTYIRIIDYKSGSKDFKLSDVYYGLQMQLLVYLDALLNEIERIHGENAFPAAMLYFKLDDPIIKTKGELTVEEIEDKIIKELKMKGLLLADAEIIKAMDRNVDGSSDILPVRINKDNTIGKSSSAATQEQFKLLREYVRGMIVKLCEEMLEGNISIKPYKKTDTTTPCRYCEYSSVCQFDTTISGNGYRFINDKSDDEVWELIKKSVEE